MGASIPQHSFSRHETFAEIVRPERLIRRGKRKG